MAAVTSATKSKTLFKLTSCKTFVSQDTTKTCRIETIHKQAFK